MKLTEKHSLIVSVLCLSVVFCGFVSAEGSKDAPLYSSKNAYSESVYFAQAPSMKTPEKELSECLFRVARQVSMRQEVFVRYILSSKKDSDGKIWKSESTVLDFDQNNSIAIMEKMTVLKVRQSKEGTEALVKINGNKELKNISVSIKTQIDGKGNPLWVTSVPKGSKFYASVGSIQQTTNLADAFYNADTNAIGALALFTAKPEVSGGTSLYEATLKGVYIARRWYNPSENRYYSLAILPR